MYYCTVAEAQRETKSGIGSANTDADVMLGYIRIVSRRIDLIMNPTRNRPFFAPYIEQREFDINGNRVNSRKNTFLLEEHLLSLSAVVNVSTTITSVEAYPTSRTPANKLRLTARSLSWYDQYNEYGDAANEVLVTGTWGYHSDWDNAFVQVDTLAANIANVTDKTFTVNDIDGADQWGVTPRISPGALVRIGSEYMLVSQTDTATNIATVLKRGENGSTAAAHSSNDPVYVYQVPEPVKRITAKQAGHLYARKGQYETARYDGIGITEYPADMVPELYATLTEYQYV